MQSAFQLDHVVIHVTQLAQAMADYTSLGFTVFPGGEHKGRESHNALVIFADGTYLELIAFTGTMLLPSRPIAKEARARELLAMGLPLLDTRVLTWKTAGEGVVDFALLPGPIEETVTATRSRGLDMDGPHPGGRTRPDGRQVAWKLALPDGYDLPFLCADETPRVLRVPEGDVRRHANGADGVANVKVAVNDLNTSLARHRVLLGIEKSQIRFSTQPGVKLVDFPLGWTTITLAEPVGRDSPLRQVLSTRGEGPFELSIRTSRREREGPLDLVRAHQAAIHFVGPGS